MVMDRVRLIAEVGCNHQGNFVLAKKMIDELSELSYRPDVVKFQKRTPKLILSESKYNTPHPDKENAFGPTYGLHKEFLEFSTEQHAELKKYCENKGFEYSCSVFDSESAKNILSLSPKMIKISSANNNDLELLKYIDENFDGEIHISLGMTTKAEEEKIFETIKNNRKNLILYACTSAYPVFDNDLCLLEIQRLKDRYGKEIKAIGFSGHHLGVVQDVAAIALGATYIERHFTLDKTMKGTDQSISLTPVEFLQLGKNIQTTVKALTYKPVDILTVEQDVRKRLKWE